MSYEPTDWATDTRTKLNVAPNEQAQKQIEIKHDSTFHQVVKDTHYPITLGRVNGESYLKFNLTLSTADNPKFTLYYGLSSTTLTLINAGNTSSVVGSVEFIKIPNGTIVNAVYSYVKNGTAYHENQNTLIDGIVEDISFGADNGYTYTTSSYVKITNK